MKDEHEVRKSLIEDKMIEAANQRDQKPTPHQLSVTEAETVGFEVPVGEGEIK